MARRARVPKSIVKGPATDRKQPKKPPKGGKTLSHKGLVKSRSKSTTKPKITTRTNQYPKMKIRRGS
jgi:hypothetical protein